MVRLYGFKYSTNVDRVALALAYKQIPTEVVRIDPADRSPVRSISGQDLVPIIEDGGEVVHDSTAILLWLEDRYPVKPLVPADRARRAELEIFLDWFNRVWKRPPNVITGELENPNPDRDLIERMGREMIDALDRFEALLTDREYLWGREFSLADCAAWPFLWYATVRYDDDPWLFHRVLWDWQEPIRRGERPRLAAWIERVAKRPRIPV
jgi:glutathione S-transferase